jgi:hypothetical protein
MTGTRLGGVTPILRLRWFRMEPVVENRGASI